jgi:hypothetical protein
MRVKWWKLTSHRLDHRVSRAASSTWFSTWRSSAMCCASIVACEPMKDTPRSPSSSSASRIALAKGPP